MAFWRDGSGRVAVSFIGEGGSSLGEWHEAINLCAARRLPAIFCVENNQTALSTPVADQSAVRVFADKAAGYGIPGITIDGTDPDAIAAAFAWAAERARAGLGPALIELVAMRMCGHAHHDDMLYLGRDPQAAWDYAPLTGQGLRRTRALRVLVDARSDSRLRRQARGRRRHRGGRPRSFQARDSSDGGRAGRRHHRRALAGRRPGGRRRVRERAAARARRGARPRLRGCGPPARPRCRRSMVVRRSIRRAARSSTPSCSASATRCAPTRACSSTARTSAATTATRSCCCGRC